MRQHIICILPFGLFIIGLWGCHPKARVTAPEAETQTLAPLEAAQEPDIVKPCQARDRCSRLVVLQVESTGKCPYPRSRANVDGIPN